MTASPAPAIVKLQSVELARAVAAIAVVLYHAARHLDKNVGFPLGKQAFQFGHAGVDFFFVISGFIILHVHGGDLGRPRRLGHYAARRFTRIYPIYWVILGLTVAAAFWSGRIAAPTAAQVGWAATLLPTRAEPLVGVAWTLQHEIIFYAVFAVLILHRGAGLALLGVWLAAIAVALAGQPVGLMPVFVSAYNLEFFLGMGAAWWVRQDPVAFSRDILWVGLTLITALAAAEVAGWFDGYAPSTRWSYGLASALIVVGLVGRERGGHFRSAAAMAWLGRASYSIYLFHLTFIGLADKLWDRIGLGEWVWARYAILVVAGIGGGIVVSRLVEYPLMRLVRRLFRYLSR
ncbi:acyltransferase family protein [Magnetospirillum moscoviense]|uniref:Acyltransferase 3 domain-containing protein n=1 Tax=Magnetospirillum moscoviense TaxID=1437059 RepID=A0A178MTW3_9PROT|nr:acyltransferase [Magnetospirillum moscoviense]OAN51541.1 hypothetical protein A6A05_01380 [Magnetospirillum moscoviense]